ncbi:MULTISPECIES: NmrA family NAD(P)-binding protein [Streptomyces]|uniref:NmrA family NAD(P)-binding protein n=1 Tax=Streptomyces siderophoricus TaxID=2802281 RepID=A0ABS1N1X8_9ACTN|nr:NmrA family NAD(P)-binding protein [Streptomyces sp. 9-7]MBL1094003.1 NmrA family NAD(P)-binding protein [Streptomyces sp. 9-7]
MEPTGKTVVVAGATGLQGRAVTQHLLLHGWQVRALTRDPHGAQAREIHPGRMDFGTWLERTGASQIAAFLDSARTAGHGA